MNRVILNIIESDLILKKNENIVDKKNYENS